MRGGAIPVAAFGTLLLVLGIGNVIWDAKPVNYAAALTGSAIVYATALGLWLARRREAFRRGAPEASEEPEALPQASYGAMLVGLAAGATLFGMVWARFLVYFGLALLLASLFRVGQELHSERRTRRRIKDGQP